MFTHFIEDITTTPTWNLRFESVHVDQHAAVFHPQNPDLVILGNDGGVYLSEDGGITSQKLNGLPITQFYRGTMDEQYPERLYGGTQDNGTNRTLTGNVDDWEEINGGDGFFVLVDPTDNNFIYSESQNGVFARSINGGQSFVSALNGFQSSRNNWNTPVVFDPNNSEVLYMGGNRLNKSVNRANSWNPISPDSVSYTHLTLPTICSV